ncbi:hypothetical protein FCM35_KLT19229 [Carex littledalei]|uniref:Secreted protein n=1 Tax=Carex littledalei TaxID=544730 RepID=A0A833VV79_9POAL|nr:hypothetical protein FCM35_KLT19229 [Carex littledalei]
MWPMRTQGHLLVNCCITASRLLRLFLNLSTTKASLLPLTVSNPGGGRLLQSRMEIRDRQTLHRPRGPDVHHQLFAEKDGTKWVPRVQEENSLVVLGEESNSWVWRLK